MTPLTVAVLSLTLAPLGSLDLPFHTLQAVHPTEATTGPLWFRDYATATAVARLQGRMLWVHFAAAPAPGADSSAAGPRAPQEFDETTLVRPDLTAQCAQFVFARVPVDARIHLGGQETALLGHPAFHELKGQPGLAIVDFTSADPRRFGQVVSIFPAPPGKRYDERALRVILSLPPGTLTERTMIYAVRMHPEAPQSTTGVQHPVLQAEAHSHAQHQAAIILQGHHQWDQRFQRISHRIGGTPTEVCAESWAGQGLVEAAVECVRCWRLSPGHWSAVRGRHSHYGYDIRRGSNGVWYATGIFANLRR